VIAAVTLGTVLAPLNSTMIAVALPRITDDFHVSVRAADWLVTSYLIALAIGQPVSGRLGDRVGRRRMMLAGLIAFLGASIGAAVAPNLATLIVFRVAQAVSGAAVFPNGAAVLRVLLANERRGRGFGIVGGVLASAAAIGPLVGGLALSVSDWRAIFLVNIPLVAGALVLTWRWIPSTSRSEGPSDSLFGLGAFGYRTFRAAAGGVAFSNLAYYSMLISIPVLLEKVRGWSSGDVGLALAVLSGPAALLAPVGGHLSDRFGGRVPAVAGNVLLAAAGLPLVLDPRLPSAALLVLLGLMGCGVGLSAASLQTAAVEAVSATDAGSAAGMFSTSRYLGSIAGTVVLAALLAPRAGAFRPIFVMVLVAGVLSVVAAAALPGRAASRKEPEIADEQALGAARVG